jgi:hypothetical protein
VYLVDLETGAVEQKLDWNDPSISWEGRGADRGLRGIAFHGDTVYLAASDEIFAFDRDFNRIGSFGNRYLKHCHEITIADGVLYATSTGFDSVLEYDLSARRFVRGVCLRYGTYHRAARRLDLRPRPRVRRFDPNGDGGPAPGDTVHVNNVVVVNGMVFVSGVGLGNVWALGGRTVRSYARIPFGSHNARPFRDGVLMNHTATDRVAFVDRRGHVLRSFPLVRYELTELEHSHLPADKARQAFGRGLTTVGDDLLIGGSSPATITAYRFDPPTTLKSVNLTMDVRNAIHGLEVWPFQPSG